MPGGMMWGRWLAVFGITGAAAGILWWLAAPTGAFYGDGKDYIEWFPRDAVLALLLTLAGVGAGLLALWTRRRRRRNGDGTVVPEGVLVLVLAVGGLAGSVLAWRMGVFAGDLFGSPPSPMENPSMVFSLRSGPVLVLWPLASVLVLFLRSLYSYAFLPAALDHEVGSSR
ncbi:hypothetical protein [Arthrobacter sp. H35-D1]|uniref:hypothetical protein n=1 Tax=Arthrobacter sp. H35-D1 TaxID=3046202 RepID=UPI0024BB1C31|nr:hypothetical protein [Arthrobacter sp. H35-D1]MDJ0313235.1 hypothetical protein [Arthrobacter sp. H35-D1]